MNDLVKNSINARKTAMTNAYEINNEDILNQIENLFNKINELGETCKDSMEFETKLASSPLNQEYIDLFTKIATTCKPVVNNQSNEANVKSTGEYIAEDIASEVKYQMESATQPLKHQAYQEAYDKVRDIPVVGEALNIKQHIDFFKRFKKKK